MEELETLEGESDCPECPGPPPEFRLPPPPRPPFLTEGTFCSEAPLAELEDCVAIPMIDASYHTNPSLQSTALIITCAVVLLLMAAIISVVFWKHKRKVQNLLPCKSQGGPATSSRGRVLPDGQSRSGIGPEIVGGGPVLYEDLPEAAGHPQHTQMLNIKDIEGRGVFVCSSPGPEAYNSQDSYNPVYEELSNGDDHPDTGDDDEVEPNARGRIPTNRRRRPSISGPGSEDEFAEDELSLGEPADARMPTSVVAAWATCPASSRHTPRGRKGRTPGSLDRRPKKVQARDLGEFHEGKILDALLQLYPSVTGAGESSVSNGRQRSVPSVARRLPYLVPALPPAQPTKTAENPYECVPVLGPLHRYSTHGGGPKGSRFGYSRYSSEYYELPNQQDLFRELRGGVPTYNEVGGDYSDAYSQPTDRLYSDDKYAQPIYYTARDPDHLLTGGSGRLYQGQPDSSFGSDSGYSHHTSGTTGTRGSTSQTNRRKDKHGSSQHSHRSLDYAVS